MSESLQQNIIDLKLESKDSKLQTKEDVKSENSKNDSAGKNAADNDKENINKEDKKSTDGKTDDKKELPKDGEVKEGEVKEVSKDEQAILSNLAAGDKFECSLEKKCMLGDAKSCEGNKKMEYKARQWHEKCFCCVVCRTAIGTKSFIPREQEIYCTGCYEEKFATRCIKCNKIITSGGVTYKNEPWHRECFTCTNCDSSLAGQRFTSRDEKPYCADCFGNLFAKRCIACENPITGIGGTRFISFEDRHWHNDCFICAMCKNSLVGKGFITDGSDILCPECAKQKLA